MNNLQLPLDQILQGNCIEILANFPENSVDLIFADPPYNLQLQGDLHRPDASRVVAVDEAWDKFSSFDEYDDFTGAWLEACRRVLKDDGTIWVIGSYHNIFRVGATLQELRYWVLNDITWIKTNPMPNFRGVRFTNAQETLIWAQKNQGASYTFNHHDMKALNGDLQMRSDWYIPLCTGKERLKINGVKVHPTQKPEALLFRVLMSSSNPGDVVLDPFFGTGTTGAVAKRLKRHWIGIERDPRYIRVATKRIQQVQPVEAYQEMFIDRHKRGLNRVPFGALLEHGLLEPGQKLYFGAQGEVFAKVLPNGHIQYNGQRGSIHQVAKELKGGPCNGWDQWYYCNKTDDERIVIDKLRQRVRRLMQRKPVNDKD